MSRGDERHHGHERADMFKDKDTLPADIFNGKYNFIYIHYKLLFHSLSFFTPTVFIFVSGLEVLI